MVVRQPPHGGHMVDDPPVPHTYTHRHRVLTNQRQDACPECRSVHCHEGTGRIEWHPCVLGAGYPLCSAFLGDSHQLSLGVALERSQ